MRMHDKIAVTASVVSIGVASALLGAAPALAADVSVPTPTAGSGANGPYHVLADCTPAGGVVNTANQTTYAFVADAMALSTNGTLGVATSFTCYVYGRATHLVYGTVSTSAAGPLAIAEGTVVVPTKLDAALCIKAHATFSDGGAAGFNNCPF